MNPEVQYPLEVQYPPKCSPDAPDLTETRNYGRD
jgi:hypothetical protein